MLQQEARRGKQLAKGGIAEVTEEYGYPVRFKVGREYVEYGDGLAAGKAAEEQKAPAVQAPKPAGALSVEVNIPEGGSAFAFKKMGTGAEVRFVAARRAIARRGFAAGLYLAGGVVLWLVTVRRR